MAEAKHALVQQTQNPNIAPQLSRRKIVREEGVFFRHSQFVQKASLHLRNFL